MSSHLCKWNDDYALEGMLNFSLWSNIRHLCSSESLELNFLTHISTHEGTKLLLGFSDAHVLNKNNFGWNPVKCAMIYKSFFVISFHLHVTFNLWIPFSNFRVMWKREDWVTHQCIRTCQRLLYIELNNIYCKKITIIWLSLVSSLSSIRIYSCEIQNLANSPELKIDWSKVKLLLNSTK